MSAGQQGKREYGIEKAVPGTKCETKDQNNSHEREMRNTQSSIYTKARETKTGTNEGESEIGGQVGTVSEMEKQLL